jgi:DNA-directed RNA polymerase specialized sigma subunit
MDATRAVRRDLGSIDAALASRILTECAPGIDAEVRRLRPALRHTQGIGVDDLHALGQIAALEAYLTWEAGRGRTLRSWAGQVVRWRLTGAVMDAQSPEESRGTPPQRPEDVVDPALDHDEAERQAWLLDTVGKLAPRLRVLVVSKLRGEEQAATARTLGIGQGRVSQEIRVAIVTLQAAAADAGLLDDVDANDEAVDAAPAEQ